MFFVLGCNLEQNMDVALRIVQDGHRLGNHTFSHARDGVLTPLQLRTEINATDALIRQVHAEAGMPAPKDIPLRLPYGCAPEDSRAHLLASMNRPHVGWTLMLDDWQRPPPSAGALADAMAAHVRDRLRLEQSAVLCLHDSSRHGDARPATVAAVEKWLRETEVTAHSQSSAG